MLHEINKYLVEQGHSVDVLIPILQIKPYDLEGVKVYPDSYPTNRDFIKKADLIITHLDRAGKAINLAEYYNKPLVYVNHNSNNLGILRHKPQIRRYVIYNSEFTKRSMNYPCPGIVVHPPVDGKRYKVNKRGSKLTLINLFHRKGALTFQQIARMLPDRDFLGVEGGYGRQEKENLPNITYMENQKDMKKVYSQTKILLMPSLYESYGRTAVEAMASGIPVIASPTDGLIEALDSAGIFAPAEEPQAWVEAIKKVEEDYDTISKKCSDRFKVITEQTKLELKEMEDFLFDIYQRKI